MSEHSEKIETFRVIFEKAKSASRNDNGDIEDQTLSINMIDALMDVADEKIFELKDEIYHFIYDPCSDYRELAVRCLGDCNYFQLDEFRDVAYEIWLKDPSIEVKYAALSAWAGYYRETYDPKVLKCLYEVICSNQYQSDIKTIALYRFMQVSDDSSVLSDEVSIFEMAEKDNEEFNEAINWKEMSEVMQKCRLFENDPKIKKNNSKKKIDTGKIEFKRSRKIEDLKKVLIVAKDSPRGPDGYPKDEGLGWEVYLTLAEAGEKPLHALKEEIYPYLYDPCEEFRELAVKALGDSIGLHLEEFKDLAYKIFEDDPSEKVKFSALSAWVGYYENTYNPSVLKRLHAVFQGEYKGNVRAVALHGLLSVANAFKDEVERGNIYGLEGSDEYSDYIKAVNLDRIKKIMDQYAI